MIRSKSSSAHNRLWWCGDKLTHGGIVWRRRIETKDAINGDTMWLDVDSPCCRTENLLQVYLFYVNLKKSLDSIDQKKLIKLEELSCVIHTTNITHSKASTFHGNQQLQRSSRPSLKTPKHNRHASQKRCQPRNTFGWEHLESCQKNDK